MKAKGPITELERELLGILVPMALELRKLLPSGAGEVRDKLYRKVMEVWTQKFGDPPRADTPENATSAMKYLKEKVLIDEPASIGALRKAPEGEYFTLNADAIRMLLSALGLFFYENRRNLAKSMLREKKLFSSTESALDAARDEARALLEEFGQLSDEGGGTEDDEAGATDGPGDGTGDGPGDGPGDGAGDTAGDGGGDHAANGRGDGAGRTGDRVGTEPDPALAGGRDAGTGDDENDDEEDDDEEDDDEDEDEEEDGSAGERPHVPVEPPLLRPDPATDPVMPDELKEAIRTFAPACVTEAATPEARFTLLLQRLREVGHAAYPSNPDAPNTIERNFPRLVEDAPVRMFLLQRLQAIAQLLADEHLFPEVPLPPPPREARPWSRKKKWIVGTVATLVVAVVSAFTLIELPYGGIDTLQAHLPWKRPIGDPATWPVVQSAREVDISQVWNWTSGKDPADEVATGVDADAVAESMNCTQILLDRLAEAEKKHGEALAFLQSDEGQRRLTILKRKNRESLIADWKALKDVKLNFTEDLPKQRQLGALLKEKLEKKTLTYRDLNQLHDLREWCAQKLGVPVEDATGLAPATTENAPEAIVRRLEAIRRAADTITAPPDTPLFRNEDGK